MVTIISRYMEEKITYQPKGEQIGPDVGYKDDGADIKYQSRPDEKEKAKQCFKRLQKYQFFRAYRGRPILKAINYFLIIGVIMSIINSLAVLFIGANFVGFLKLILLAGIVFLLWWGLNNWAYKHPTSS